MHFLRHKSVLHISEILLYICIGFIVSTAICLWFQFSFITNSFLIGLFLSINILLFYGDKRKILILFCFSVGGLLAILNFYRFNLSHNFCDLKSEERLILKVISVPKTKKFSKEAFAISETGYKYKINLSKHAEIYYGSIIEGLCEKNKPKNYGSFDYASYLKSKGVKCVCNLKDYKIIGNSNDLFSKLANLRRLSENNVSKVIPNPQAALANGLLFGGDDRLSDEMRQNFSLTGMTHIVAVSGYNVSVIVFVVIFVGIYIGLTRKMASILALILIFLFVAMIGFPASGVRAGIMGSIIIFALLSGRVGNWVNILIFACAVMIIFNPFILRYDIGFQLSFLATLGIFTIYPIFERIIKPKNIVLSALWEILLLTLSVQLLVLPIIIYNFHIFSVSSFITNLLILPILPFTMFFVFLCVIFGFLNNFLSMIFGWLAYFLLSYEVEVIKFFANQIWSYIIINDIKAYILWIYYGILLFALYYLDKFLDKRS